MQRDGIVSIETGYGLSPEHVLECLELIEVRRGLGMSTDYQTMRGHLASDVRHNQWTPLSVLPACIVSHAALSLAMSKVGVNYGQVNYVGHKAAQGSTEKQEKRLWRHRVWLVDANRSRRMELEGTAVVFSQDESYIHSNHRSAYGLSGVGETGQKTNELHGRVGKGDRVCMNGELSRWGHLVCTKPDGDFVRDCAFLDGKGNPVVKGGGYNELNNEGKPRAIYLRRATRRLSLKTMRKPELLSLAAEYGLETSILGPSGQPKVLTIAQLIVIIEAHRASVAEPPTAVAADTTANTVPPTVGDLAAGDAAAQELDQHVEDLDEESGLQSSARLALFTNWGAYESELGDMALTTDKFMIAGKSHGDYHDNFDYKSFFKSCVAVKLTYPPWCRERQREFEAGTLDPPAEKGFYDWEADRPLRALHMQMDNAPYHWGVTCQLASMSKEAIGTLLWDKGVREVLFPHTSATGEPITARAEVPKPGTAQKWKSGFPSKPQLLAAAKTALLTLDPQLVEPPWQKLLRSVKDEWGPPGEDGWEVDPACPYVSDEIAIELKWAVGKNHCALPEQQQPNRLIATVIDQITTYWYTQMGPKTFDGIFRHCDDQMEKWMRNDREQNGGPLSGRLGSLQGLPTAEEYKVWREKAGLMGDDAVTGDEDDNDMFFRGEEEEH